MKAREIMTRRVIAATEETTAIDLARKVLPGFFSGLPVVDSDGQVVGVVTEKDLLVLIADDPRKLHETRAADIMTSPATCIDKDARGQAARGPEKGAARGRSGGEMRHRVRLPGEESQGGVQLGSGAAVETEVRRTYGLQ